MIINLVLALIIATSTLQCSQSNNILVVRAIKYEYGLIKNLLTSTHKAVTRQELLPVDKEGLHSLAKQTPILAILVGGSAVGLYKKQLLYTWWQPFGAKLSEGYANVHELLQALARRSTPQKKQDTKFPEPDKETAKSETQESTGALQHQKSSTISSSKKAVEDTQLAAKKSNDSTQEPTDDGNGVLKEKNETKPEQLAKKENPEDKVQTLGQSTVSSSVESKEKSNVEEKTAEEEKEDLRKKQNSKNWKNVMGQSKQLAAERKVKQNAELAQGTQSLVTVEDQKNLTKNKPLPIPRQKDASVKIVVEENTQDLIDLAEIQKENQETQVELAAVITNIDVAVNTQAAKATQQLEKKTVQKNDSTEDLRKDMANWVESLRQQLKNAPQEDKAAIQEQLDIAQKELQEWENPQLISPDTTKKSSTPKKTKNQRKNEKKKLKKQKEKAFLNSQAKKAQSAAKVVTKPAAQEEKVQPVTQVVTKPTVSKEQEEDWEKQKAEILAKRMKKGKAPLAIATNQDVPKSNVKAEEKQPEPSLFEQAKSAVLGVFNTTSETASTNEADVVITKDEPKTPEKKTENSEVVQEDNDVAIELTPEQKAQKQKEEEDRWRQEQIEKLERAKSPSLEDSLKGRRQKILSKNNESATVYLAKNAKVLDDIRQKSFEEKKNLQLTADELKLAAIVKEGPKNPEYAKLTKGQINLGSSFNKRLEDQENAKKREAMISGAQKLRAAVEGNDNDPNKTVVLQKNKVRPSNPFMPADDSQPIPSKETSSNDDEWK